MRAHLANIITGSRILCSIWMLFCPVFSVGFFVIYLFCGFTDMVDGTIARRTNTASEFGARLDTVADILFTAVAFLKILPALRLQVWLRIWILLIACIKIGNYMFCAVSRKGIVSLHTAANKLTGLLLFLLPLTLPLIDLRISAPVVCVVASVSAIQEGRAIGTGRKRK